MPVPQSARVLRDGLLTALILFVGVPVSMGAGAYIRVNQVGYASGGSKRAYLMASAAETGARFAVTNSGGTAVFSGSVGASIGAWGNFPQVYALDFDSVSAPGTYTIS